MFPYSNTHHRLAGYDYRSTGAYFITICTAQRRHIFGECKQGKMRASLLGQIVERCWLDIPNHRPYIILDAFSVMPNHVRGIMFITETADMMETGDASVAATKKIQGKSLSVAIGSFKASVTKQAHDAGLFTGSPI